MIYTHKNNPTIIVNSLTKPQIELKFIAKHGRFSSKCPKWVKESLELGEYILDIGYKVRLTERGRILIDKIKNT